MTTTRYITSALRSGLLMTAGPVLFVLPVVLGLGGAAIVFGIAAGVIAVALGISGTATTGRGTIPLTAQAAYDRGLAFGLVLAGLIFGIAGQPLALALFAGAGVAALAIGGLTRYTATHV